jgi:hypothetical protein
VWVLPVGPCTNIASAILLAREEGLDLKSRTQIVWLGGGPERVNAGSHNGGSDPWSVYVTGQGDVEFWIILENPTGSSLRFEKRVESHLYPNNPLGEYLKKITPADSKALYKSAGAMADEMAPLDEVKRVAEKTCANVLIVQVFVSCIKTHT